ncbi:MAG: cell wall hydrolase [Parvularculaceae bacterium]|nr:cell wall hydrolase [Parvularculaceae bacterium]
MTSHLRFEKFQAAPAGRAKGDHRHDRWLSVSFTGRSLIAAGSLSVCVLLTALSATAAVERAELKKAETESFASQAELAAGLAEYLADKTEDARAAVAAVDLAPALKPARTMASIVESDGALADFVAFDFKDIDEAAVEASERTCLAQAIYYEARSEPRFGQMAVADVVLNRVKSPLYPDTICGVVYQGSERRTGCQFTFTCDGSLDRPIDARQMRASMEMAGAVMAGVRAPASHNATHYHADYVAPVWANEMTRTTTIGTHVFYKFASRGGSKPANAKAAM